MPDGSSPTPPAHRARLAEQQGQLIDALLRGASPPARFDHDQVARSGESLIGKRARSVAKTWPGLAEALGESFRARFREYAVAYPLTTASTIDDGQRFAAWLLKDGSLPVAVAPALLAVRLRTGWPVRALRVGGALWIGFRVPGLGVRIVALKRGGDA